MFLFGFPMLLTGSFFMGPIFIIVGYFLAFHLEKRKKNDALKSIGNLTNEKVLNVMPATYRNDTTNSGFLAVTQNYIVFNRKNENYSFPLNTINSIGTTTEGTGNFISTVQKSGYSNTISTTEIKKVLFYIQGYKNNETYLEYFYCNDIWWGNRTLNRFYKTVKEAGNFNSSASSSLDKHKVQ